MGGCESRGPEPHAFVGIAASCLRYQVVQDTVVADTQSEGSHLQLYNPDRTDAAVGSLVVGDMAEARRHQRAVAAGKPGGSPVQRGIDIVAGHRQQASPGR